MSARRSVPLDDAYFDVAVVGSGAVGMAAALMLERLSFKTCLIGPLANSDSRHELKSWALAHSSCKILVELGIDLQALEPTPIRHIRYSQLGSLAELHLTASHLPSRCFGYMVLAAALNSELETRIHALKNSLVRTEAMLQRTERHGGYRALYLEDGSRIRARVVILATGADTAAGDITSTPAMRIQSRWNAVMVQLSSDRPHHGCAWERSGSCGLLALLPLNTHHFKAVWLRGESQRSDYEPAQTWSEHIQRYLGFRAGRLSARGHVHIAPIWRSSRDDSGDSQDPSLMYIGDAYRTLVPAGAQGLNSHFIHAFELVQTLKAEWQRLKQDGLAHTDVARFNPSSVHAQLAQNQHLQKRLRRTRLLSEALLGATLLPRPLQLSTHSALAFLHGSCRKLGRDLTRRATGVDWVHHARL